jgi:signal transduction histidine kinase
LLEIKDEGIGFDIHKINHVHSKTKGISGIKHRAETIHADYSIDSVMGQGTTISILGAVKSENNDKK